MAPLPFLDWPRDLFAAANANSTAPLLVNKSASERFCAFSPCQTPHNNRVSGTRSQDGVHKVYWFCCGEHQRKWYAGARNL